MHRHRWVSREVLYPVDVSERALLHLARAQDMSGVILVHMHVVLLDGPIGHADAHLGDLVVVKPRLLPRQPREHPNVDEVLLENQTEVAVLLAHGYVVAPVAALHHAPAQLGEVGGVQLMIHLSQERECAGQLGEGPAGLGQWPRGRGRERVLTTDSR